MPVFNYRAVDAAGRVATGRMPATDARALEAQLRAAGRELVICRVVPLARAGRVPRRAIIALCMQMHQMLRAGVMLPDAIAELSQDSREAALRDTLVIILESVRGGKTLSAALEQFPESFDGVFLGLIRAGEASGKLAEAFEALAENAKWRDELSAQIRKAVMYPAFTGVVLVAVMTFLLVYLVPQLAGFLKTSTNGKPLATQTQILLALSDFVRNDWPWLVAAPFFLAAAVWGAFRFGGEPLRLAIDRAVLKIPVVGTLIERVTLARFASVFGLLYGAGLSILAALDICKSAMGNRVYAQAITASVASVTQGRTITQSFGDSGAFPPMFLRMLRVGEQTGEIDTALKNVAYFYDRDVKELVSRLQSLIEPMLTLVMGAALAWLMSAVMGPLYDSLTKLQN